MVENIALKDKFSGVRVMKSIIDAYISHIKFKSISKCLSSGDFNLNKEFNKYLSLKDQVNFEPFSKIGNTLTSQVNLKKQNIDQTVTCLKEKILPLYKEYAEECSKKWKEYRLDNDKEKETNLVYQNK